MSVNPEQSNSDVAVPNAPYMRAIGTTRNFAFLNISHNIFMENILPMCVIKVLLYDAPLVSNCLEFAVI